MTVECASCGGRFEAKRRTAKYCSPRCRKRAERAPEGAPPHRESTPLKAVPPAPVGRTLGLYEATERDLIAVDRLATPLGQAALILAQRLDNPSVDTGSSIASLIREHRAALKAALEGTQKTESTLEELRRRRAERRPAGA